ncbi:hypothetical protein MCEMSEM29_01811 [Methylophilaceae bacterium]
MSNSDTFKGMTNTPKSQPSKNIVKRDNNDEYYQALANDGELMLLIVI